MGAPDDRRARDVDGDVVERFLATARRLRPAASVDELLAVVAAGVFDLDAGDTVSLHLSAGGDAQVAAVVPPSRPRTTSAVARRAIARGDVVRRDEVAGAAVAVPVVVADEVRGALLVRRPPGRPAVSVDAVRLAAVLLGGAVATQRWLDGQRELDRARSNFVARVSHELRTPLTIIAGFAATLLAQDELLTSADRHRMLDRILTASARLEHLVEELLTLASVELGVIRPDVRVCAVRDVIDVVVRDRSGGERCEVRCPAELRVATDPVVARLVLAPVVENALRHGERVEIVASAQHDGVRIEVRDDGPGIPEHLGDTVFQRFVRGDDRTPGMGLGLPTAREVGAVVGARLSLLEVPVGATVVIELPDRAVPVEPGWP